MMKFVVPCDEDDYGDTDVWHSLIAALQQLRQFLLFRHSGGGVVFSLDVAWLFFLTFVRNMDIGSWLLCFFIMVKRV